MSRWIFAATLFVSQAACASSPPKQIEANQLYTGANLNEVTPSQLVRRIQPGDVVIVSENHGFAPHHEHQREILKALAESWPQTPISVGMEFFEYPDQAAVDQFLKKQLSEDDFLARIRWGQPDFKNYREQVLFPSSVGGRTLALNTPRTLAKRIGEVGLEGLTAEEAQLLPPSFQKGNAAYYERFVGMMNQVHPLPEETLQKRFWAQSLWDDTMAWKTAQFMKDHPDHIFVLIVGDFHTIYGGGLPDRLRARGMDRVIAISQVNVSDLNAMERYEEVAPDARWGIRADVIWPSEQR